MSPADVKAKIPGQPGVRKRCIAAQNRFKKSKAALDNCWQMQLLGNSFRTHIVAPMWQDNEPCHSLFEKWQPDFQMIDDLIGRTARLLWKRTTLRLIFLLDAKLSSHDLNMVLTTIWAGNLHISLY